MWLSLLTVASVGLFFYFNVIKALSYLDFKIYINTSNILLIGQAGAGKSTLAKRLAQKHHLTYINLDEMIYGANWTRRSLTEVEALLKPKLDKAGYIIEGVYFDPQDTEQVRTRLMDKLVQAGEINRLIWLDVSKYWRLYRLIKRSIKRIIGLEVAGVCAETWSGVREMLLNQLDSSKVCRDIIAAKWLTWSGQFSRSYNQYNACINIYMLV